MSEEVDLAALRAGKVSINAKTTKPAKYKLVLEDQVDYVVKPKKITIDEENCIAALVKKYKTDFSKMFRDTKINKFQWSEK